MGGNPCILLFVILFALQVSPRPIGTIRCYQLLGENDNESEIRKRQIECPNFMQDGSFSMGRSEAPPELTEEEKREERKRKMFEGLLHFATVVNHVDNFFMDKGKLFLKSLGKMVASEEDPRFEM